MGIGTLYNLEGARNEACLEPQMQQYTVRATTEANGTVIYVAITLNIIVSSDNARSLT
jgi:hypothetical protein